MTTATRRKRPQVDPELLAAINGWKRLSHTELAIACQAMFALATHGDVPQWIRNSAEGIAADLRGKLPRETVAP